MRKFTEYLLEQELNVSLETSAKFLYSTELFPSRLTYDRPIPDLCSTALSNINNDVYSPPNYLFIRLAVKLAEHSIISLPS
jgi:hypothetical protein